MSKPSSSSDSAEFEFEFELDIGEDVAPAPPKPSKPKDKVPEADEDSGADYVILKRKARTPKADNAGDGRLQVSDAPASEAVKGHFKPKKLDGGIVGAVPVRSSPASPDHELGPSRERPGLEGIGRAKDSRNRMAGTGNRGILQAVASIREAGVRLSGLAHLRSNKAVLAVVLTVTILGLVLRMIFSGTEKEPIVGSGGDKQEAGVIATAKPILEEQPSRGTAVLLLKSQSGESDEQRNYRAQDTLEKFFQAKSAAGMSAFIRDPQRVQPLIEDYYSRHAFAMPGVSEITRFQEIMINLKVFLVADIVLEGKGASTVVLQDSGEGFVVDWETYVCYNPMDWEDFYRKRPGQAMSLRVFATIDHNPGFAFPGEAEWLCVRLIGRDSDEELYGYARTGSQTALRLREMLYDEWEFPCILQLQFPEDGKGGDRQVHIKDLVMENWIQVE